MNVPSPAGPARVSRTLLLWIVGAALVWSPVVCHAAAIRVLRIRGRCEFQRAGGEWTRINSFDLLQDGDQVRTGPGSYLQVQFASGSRARFAANATGVLHDDGNRQPPTGVVELLRGRLRLWMRHLDQRTERTAASTPIAVATVRGTEFLLQTDDQQSHVGVIEGTVLVASRGQPQNAVTVPAGYHTIVYAGRPPTPPTPMSSQDQSELSGSGSALERIEDTAAEETEVTPVERFLAFPDLHIDSIRNPAYAAKAETSDSQLFARPSMTSRGSSSSPTLVIPGAAVTSATERREQSSNGAELWTSSYRPRNDRDVLGGFITATRQSTRLSHNFDGSAVVGGAPVTFSQQGTGDNPNVQTRFRAVDAGLTWARSLPEYDIGVTVRYRDSVGKTRSLFSQTVPGLAPASELVDGRSDANLAEVVVGATKTTSGGIEWGWSVGFRDSDIDARDTNRMVNGVPATQATIHESFTTWHSDLRARKRLSDQWAWGASARIILVDGDGGGIEHDGSRFTEKVTDKLYRLGVGVAYTPSPRTALGIDLVGAVRRESADQAYASGNTKENESEDNPSLAWHIGGQHWLDADNFVFADWMLMRRRLHIDFDLFRDVAGAAPFSIITTRDSQDLRGWMLGFGHRVSESAWVEYLAAEGLESGGIEHSLLLNLRW